MESDELRESAQVYEHSVAMIRELAPEQWQDDLIALLRPAIAIETTLTEESSLPIGASKFFGDPDVPSDFHWPCCKSGLVMFVAQINLADVTSYDVEHILPTSGVLSFFLDYEMGNIPSVFYWPQVDKRMPPPHDEPQGLLEKLRAWLSSTSPGRRFPCCSLRFTHEWTLPDWDPPGGQKLAPELWDECESLFEKYYCGGHQLLGHASQVQGAVEYDAAQLAGHFKLGRDTAAIQADAPNWRLLFQMDSWMPQWMWGDVGKLYFMIRESDLEARRFEQVQVVFQNH